MSGPRLLVVEDDTALLEGLQDILELAGFDVTTGRNGLEGLEALATHGMPDLIISDIMMPRMDGYQFYDAVRANPTWVNVPFIFLTARGEKSDVRRGKLLGADDYVTKPFDEEDLLVAIRAKLKRRTQLETARTVEISDLKRSILTTLNHEFRTPLTYISTYSELITESGGDLSPADFRDFMQGIRMGSDRLRRLVEDFLLLVELQAGETQVAYDRRRAPIPDLPVLLERVVADFKPRAQAQAITLDTDIPETLLTVMGERELLGNALARLLDNAFKFSKKGGGQVLVQARLARHAASGGNTVHLRISDAGIGIRPDDVKKLFDLFHQIDRAKMEQQGSGSGLAIARGILHLHGGALHVASEWGVGSTFTVELPEWKEQSTVGSEQ